MSQEYVSEFYGTKEDFLSCLDRLSNNYYQSSKIYYINNYIVKFVDNEIHFGVERAGHSGGFWFIPRITELNDRMEFRGKIKYIGPSCNQYTKEKVINKIVVFFVSILLLPFVLFIMLFTFIKGIMERLKKQHKPKLKTTEDRLFDLMENYMGMRQVLSKTD